MDTPLPTGPLHLLIDSTGLKLFGAGEWLQEKHGQKSRRSWRKLHLAVDASTGHIEHEVASVTTDGAYDGEPTYERIAQRDTQINVIIPSRVTAQPSAQFEAAPTTRDNHLLMIQSLGRMEWQETYGYGKRALVETTMGRFKAIIGRSCVPAIRVVRRPKQMLRWRCSTAC